MRLPRVRFTVRRIMAVVAVISLVLGVSIEAFRLRRQRETYLRLVTEHKLQEGHYQLLEQSELEMAAFDESFLKQIETQAGSRPKARSLVAAVTFHKSAQYHAALKQKYLTAAARPWRSIEPDPPPRDLVGRATYWSERGDHRQAVSAYEEFLRSDTGDESALNGLAWLLATSPDASVRDGKRAIELAAAACVSSGWSDVAPIDTLAAAYAEAGDFAHAVAMQNKAIASLRAGSPDLPGFRERLQLYQNKKPYRDQAKAGP
jgi:tetratricopeptide (TPR) repeat protein